MKNLFILFILILTSCGGVGTEHRNKDGASPENSVSVDQVKQDLSKNVGCTEDVEASIIGVAQLCAANMNVDVNKTLCLVNAKNLISEHPNFVCSLESGQLVDADYIKENFISKLETEKD